MNKYKTLIIASLCLVVFCMISVFFKVFNLNELPASFAGAALGAVITGVITVILLEGQSKAEEVKERNVKVFEQKSTIFQQYINQVWQVWADQKVSAEEFQILTADYYSKLMIYLTDDSIGKIGDSLSKIGDCIDDKKANYKTLRDNVIDIINVLIEAGANVNLRPYIWHTLDHQILTNDEILWLNEDPGNRIIIGTTMELMYKKLKILCDAGAEVDLKGARSRPFWPSTELVYQAYFEKEGMRPVDFAIKRNLPMLVDLLLPYSRIGLTKESLNFAVDSGNPEMLAKIKNVLEQ
jgi:hypothetical protein